ncbi:hypothetical protein LRS06_02625 [Hymenobacter sp. J193]|uniref:hypothetical protein n=1 Tax=Hymenobacter sp. J193 TaxID=2898429 RepID=UPI0021506EB5|nr:hypothetical protein [Hymenobacter sp. J193]MCR5886686.1 hypothetical protein [Hymenobacter sp. J193]
MQDQTRQRVPGNILEWNGIKCRLEEHDGWSIDSEDKKEFGIDGTVLVAHITDTKGKVRRMLFDNRVKNGQAWKDLMEYVRDLHGVGTHRTVALARQKR